MSDPDHCLICVYNFKINIAVIQHFTNDTFLMYLLSPPVLLKCYNQKESWGKKIFFVFVCDSLSSLIIYPFIHSLTHLSLIYMCTLVYSLNLVVL